MEKDIIRFSVSLPKNLLKNLDDMVLANQYVSRSEFTRDLIREKIVKEAWNDDESDVVAVFVCVYDHHENDLVTKKMSIEHDAKIKIICTNHIHMDHHNCLETSILRGNAKLIKDFVNQISGLKSIKFTNLIKAGIPQD